MPPMEFWLIAAFCGFPSIFPPVNWIRLTFLWFLTLSGFKGSERAGWESLVYIIPFSTIFLQEKSTNTTCLNSSYILNEIKFHILFNEQ